MFGSISFTDVITYQSIGKYSVKIFI